MIIACAGCNICDARPWMEWILTEFGPKSKYRFGFSFTTGNVRILSENVVRYEIWWFFVKAHRMFRWKRKKKHRKSFYKCLGETYDSEPNCTQPFELNSFVDFTQSRTSNPNIWALQKFNVKNWMLTARTAMLQHTHIHISPKHLRFEVFFLWLLEFDICILKLNLVENRTRKSFMRHIAHVCY